MHAHARQVGLQQLAEALQAMARQGHGGYDTAVDSVGLGALCTTLGAMREGTATAAGSQSQSQSQAGGQALTPSTVASTVEYGPLVSVIACYIV